MIPIYLAKMVYFKQRFSIVSAHKEINFVRMATYRKKVLYITMFKQVAIFMQIATSMLRAMYISHFECLKELFARQ